MRIVSVAFALFIVTSILAGSCDMLPGVSNIEGMIAGEIVDSLGNPEPYKTVQIVKVGQTRTVKVVTANAIGTFLFKIEPGEYQIYIRDANEMELTIIDDTVIKVRPGRTLNITIRVDTSQKHEPTIPPGR